MSNRQYLDNSKNEKPDRLPQTGETIDGKNAAHVSIKGNYKDDLDLYTAIKVLSQLNYDILHELKIMNKQFEFITGENVYGNDDN